MTGLALTGAPRHRDLPVTYLQIGNEGKGVLTRAVNRLFCISLSLCGLGVLGASSYRRF